MQAKGWCDLPVIYVDILIGTNLLVDYLLLRLSATFLHCYPKAIRLLLSAVLGGVSSLLLLIPIENTWAFFIKCGMMLLMVVIAFGWEGIRAFVRKTAVFFGVNVAFAGLMILLWYKVLPDRIMYRNGAVYFEIGVPALVISASVCYGVLTLVSVLSRRRTMQGSVYPFALTVGGRVREGKALFDTGNTMRDVFSNRPVVVVTESFVQGILPEGFSQFRMGEIGEKGGFRLIPFSTVGTEGVLPAFPAHEARYFAGGVWHFCRDIYVAVTQQRLCAGECDALFGVPLYESSTQEEKVK